MPVKAIEGYELTCDLCKATEIFEGMGEANAKWCVIAVNGGKEVCFCPMCYSMIKREVLTRENAYCN